MTLKRRLRPILEALIRPAASRLGYSKSGKSPGSSTQELGKAGLLLSFYTLLKQLGFSPRHIVDVGANRGGWTREALRHFPEARYTLLEPQEWLKPSLQDILDSNPKVSFHAVGAGDKAGVFKFTLTERDDSCSFRYSEAEARARKCDQMDLPIVTLNEFIPSNQLPVPDIIKIDAEGLDLEVLSGASSFFGKTEIFMVEAAVANKTYKNTISEVIGFMTENGYRLFDITDMNRPWATKVLWLTELVFVRRGGGLDSVELP